jgi:acyl carrier protein
MNKKEKNLEKKPLSKEKIQQEIITIVRRFINTQKINVDTGFFELGIDSIILMQILSQINKKFNLDLSIIDLFENYDIEKLTIFIDNCLSE